MRVTRQFIDDRFGQLHLWVAGKASFSTKPLLCCHLSPKSGRIFRKVLVEFSERRFCVAPDYPGFGESDPPPDDPPVSIDDYARSVWAAADAFELSEVNVLGYHTGSMVASAMAAQQPNRVVKIISISAPLLKPSEVEQMAAEFAPITLDQAGTRFSKSWERILLHLGPGADLTWAAESFAENLRAGENYGWGHRAAFAYAQTYARLVEEQQDKLVVLNPKDDLWDVTCRAKQVLRHTQFHDLPSWGPWIPRRSHVRGGGGYRDLSRMTLSQHLGRIDRIVVFGNSGSGKSTLATHLASEWGLKHLDLDLFAFEPGQPGVRRPLKDSLSDVERFLLKCEKWVIEGCYADLIAVVANSAGQMVFLNPGVAVCHANCRSRPWEPHKYASAEEQNANLAMLLDWVADYDTRQDEFSHSAHRRVYDAFQGRKIELRENLTLS